MPVASSGNISIKTAAGSGRSIDTDGRTDISSGSLVTLSTGNVVTSGNTIDGASPHGMREFAGYTHTQTQDVTQSLTNHGRLSSQSHQMARIWEISYFGAGASFITTGLSFRLEIENQSGPNETHIYGYVRCKTGGVSTATGRSFRHTNSTTPQQLYLSTWKPFGTWEAPGHNYWDSITLISSRSTSSSGSGGVGPPVLSESNHPYTYGFHPVNQAESVSAGNEGNPNNYGFSIQQSTEAECNDFLCDTVWTQNFRFHKANHYDYNTFEWKAELSNDHYQSGLC